MGRDDFPFLISCEVWVLIHFVFGLIFYHEYINESEAPSWGGMRSLWGSILVHCVKVMSLVSRS